MGVFDLTLGPLVVGTVLNVWLYGIMITQTAMYYATYAADQKWIRWMVAWLFAIDTLNTIFDIALVWRYTVTFFGDLEAITHSHWLLNIEPVMTVSGRLIT
ncbi:hypothetical protein FRC10_003051 [Ceratobasidium sp. 414]|nr:hypothetical protein FRC10_003051 [Ceratobasidium sp. 414]